ncbi:3-isopropylmalate dehydratase small subunit [Paraburkholderia fungorum]|uniref:3-isopropylmalate dehydratase small subunit n=1 Tax=Paraburkholderia fungorum TaxID=134537 RepID=UPI0038B6C207
MKAFTVVKGPAAPLLRNNVDTDLIIRIERISQLVRGQLGPWLFETLRYREGAASQEEREEFVLNQPPFRHACILLGGVNFGCGSSREMAVWALEEFGIRCVIAPSFGDIFYNNCLQNGLLPICLDAASLEKLAAVAATGTPLEIDLRAREIRASGIKPMPFEFDAARQALLLEGLDEVDQTLRFSDEIDAFRRADRVKRSWAYMTR